VDDAVNAGLAMLRALQTYNQRQAVEGRAPVRIGIGVNTGELMLGTIGGPERMEGTVISDDVNLAARIEALTKTYRVALLISEKTYAALEDLTRYQMRSVGRARVKGKLVPVTVYEVFDADPPEVAERKRTTLDDFGEALRLYYRAEFANALALFRRITTRNPADSVTEFYVQRCARLAQTPLPTGWDGMETASE
jgi:hypothetical protein